MSYYTRKQKIKQKSDSSASSDDTGETAHAQSERVFCLPYLLAFKEVIGWKIKKNIEHSIARS